MDDARHSSTDRLNSTEHMREFADLYSHHLYLAGFVREWAEATKRDAEAEKGILEAEYLEGYARALRDITEHLEAGEALPGGPLYTRVVERIAQAERYA